MELTRGALRTKATTVCTGYLYLVIHIYMLISISMYLELTRG